MKKRGQVTLFIIIAIVIVAVLIIVFYPRIRTIFAPATPSIELQSCVEDRVEEAIELVGKRGGSIEPVNAILYQDERVEYLCYTNQYYKTCAMQQPLLRQHIEREILDYIREDVRLCVNNLKEDLRGRGYIVSDGKEDISINIIPDKIQVIVSGFSAVRAEQGERYEEFELNFRSNFYELIMLASSILNFEARLGDSDITMYMFYYPNIQVKKLKQEDGSKIYILSDVSGDKFVFASRSISWPAGYGLGETYTP